MIDSYMDGYEAGKSRAKMILLELRQHYEAHHKNTDELFEDGYSDALRDILGNIDNEDLTELQG